MSLAVLSGVCDTEKVLAYLFTPGMLPAWQGGRGQFPAWGFNLEHISQQPASEELQKLRSIALYDNQMSFYCFSFSFELA